MWYDSVYMECTAQAATETDLAYAFPLNDIFKSWCLIETLFSLNSVSPRLFPQSHTPLLLIKPCQGGPAPSHLLWSHADLLPMVLQDPAMYQRLWGKCLPWGSPWLTVPISLISDMTSFPFSMTTTLRYSLSCLVHPSPAAQVYCRGRRVSKVPFCQPRPPA